jgi:hypothetical protein
VGGDDDACWSLSINVFWRHLSEPGMYDPGDVYGNRDLLPAARAAQQALAAGRQLAALPPPYRQFYAQRCLQAMVGAAGLPGGGDAVAALS